MLVAVLAMHMLVGNFFFGRLAHIGDFEYKAQRLARQRVVGIKDDDRAFDFHHVKNLHLAVAALAFELAANLDARRKLRARNGLHQALVAQAKSVFSGQIERDLVAFFLAVQGFFDFRQRVAVAAVQINHRLFAFLDQLTLRVSDFEEQGDSGVFFNFHGGVSFRSAARWKRGKWAAAGGQS